MAHSVRTLLAFALSAIVYCAASFAQQTSGSVPTRVSPSQSAALTEVVALLDSWRGDPAVLHSARLKLDHILRSSPGVAEAHREYARYHIMSGYISGNKVAPASLAAAERSLNEALRLNPKYAEAYVLAGHLYFLRDELPQAMDALAKARAIGTSDPWLPLNTADIMIAQGRLDEAASNYETVIASGTTNRKAMLAAFSGLIRYYERTGQTQNADRTHQKQIAYEPDSAWLHGNYAAFLLCTKDDFETAIVRFRIALNQMNYGMARSGLAAALYRKWASGSRLGESADSSALFNEAQRLRTGTPAEVVTSFCRGGPAVAAVVRAASRAPATAR